MFPFCSCWRARLLLLLLAVVRESWQAEEKTCDLVGEKGRESERELALLKRMTPLFNKSFESTVGQGPEMYVYIFRVCREAGNSSGAGLVQINKSNGKETVVGRINETHIFNGSNWIMLIYKGGDEYDNHCDKEQRRAVVMISCNRHTLADNFNPVSEERGKVHDCFYLFEMDSSLACSPEVSHLSVGSVLLITMVVTLCAVLNPEMCLLRIVVWGMISWGRIQKKGMIIYYQCECTLYTRLLQSLNQSILGQISQAASIQSLISPLMLLLLSSLHPLLSSKNAFPLLPIFGFSSKGTVLGQK